MSSAECQIILKQSKAYNCFTRLRSLCSPGKWISALCAYVPSSGASHPRSSRRRAEAPALDSSSPPAACATRGHVHSRCHSPSSALTRVHGLFSSAVYACSASRFYHFSYLPCLECHSSGGGYLGLFLFCFCFLSFHIHTGLLYWDSKGLNGAFNCRSVYRGEVLSLTIVSSLSLLSLLPS